MLNFSTEQPIHGINNSDSTLATSDEVISHNTESAPDTSNVSTNIIDTTVYNYKVLRSEKNMITQERNLIEKS
jgi:hypothetical protein